GISLLGSHDRARHRALPSFPTRRSSDLVDPGAVRNRSAEAPTAGQSKPPGLRTFAPPAVAASNKTAVRDSEVAGGWDRARRSAVDRKSTRLNSSHVKISYAVFCLKKKTL